MPKNGAYWLCEFRGLQIDYWCGKCEKRGSSLGDDLLARFPDQPMPSLLHGLAAELGCDRGPNAPFNDKCYLRYEKSGEDALGIRTNPNKPDHLRTLGELQQYHQLFALCPECKRRKPISRWDIERKHGKDLTLGRLASFMRCKCGHKGAQLIVGNMSR